MKPNILAFTRENSGVPFHRVESPLKEMQSRGLIDVAFINEILEVTPEMWENVTHIIASRTFPVVPLSHFKHLCNKEGVKLIIDEDDWWSLPYTHPLYRTYDERKLSQKIQASILVADEVWTTNHHLAKKIKKLNKNVVIVPNALNEKDAQWQNTRLESETIRFGYIGGQHHQEDLKMAQIDLTGYDGYAADVDGYPELINAKKLETKKPQEYGMLYQHFDVSLAPLVPSEFAKCKSHLKMIEAGISGCALIVSDVSPYSPYITKENCLAIPHKGDWMKAIKQLNENPNQVHDLKEGLKEWAKDFRMEKINDIRWNALTNS